MEFTVIDTNRGNACIICNNFKYRRYRVLRNKEISWRCCVSTCKGHLKTDFQVSKIIDFSNAHNHEAESVKSLQMQTLRSACKRRSKSDISTRPGKIIRHELKSNAISCSDLSNMNLDAVRKAMYKVRRDKMGEIHQSRFIRLKPLAVPTLNLPTAKLDRWRNGQLESGNRLNARTCSTMSQAHETANDPASELLGNSLSAQTKSLSAELHKPKLSTSISSLAEFPKTNCATCLDETTVENKEYIMPVVEACFVASESRISNEMDYYSETCDEEYITPDFIEQNTRLKSTEADEELDIKPDIKSLELERWTNTKLESPPTNVEELDVKPFAAQNPS